MATRAKVLDLTPVNILHTDRLSHRLDPYVPPESPWVTTTFDMPEGLSKNDIRVSFGTTYGAEKITVSWQHIDVEEFVEGGKLVREKKERKYHRTLPLPKGIKVIELSLGTVVSFLIEFFHFIVRACDCQPRWRRFNYHLSPHARRRYPPDPAR